MDLIPYLSAIVLITTIATICLALLSYAGFKLRNKRKPKSKGLEDGPIFFRVYREGEAVEEQGV
jgi:hypothetical protein